MFFRLPERPFVEGEDWPSQYYRRAVYLQSEATRLLFFIIGLLFFGVLVFVFASLLTRFDTSSATAPLPERITQVEGEYEAATKQQADFGDEQRQMSDKILEQVSSLIKSSGIKQKGRFDTVTRPQIPIGAAEFSGASIAKEIDEAMQNPSYSAVTLSLNETSGQKYFDVTKDQALSIAKLIATQIGANNDMLQRTHEYQANSPEITQRINHAGELLKRLKDRQLDEEANKDKIHRDATDVSTQQLVLTSVTRFGTLGIVLFLVAILIPLYKYNVRLASFYISIGDALAMTKLENDKNGNLELLVRLLTPTYDFGRSPKTPMDQLVELVRAARETKVS